VSALVEAVLPSRLGLPFRWLVASSWTTNLGDGVALAAGPLLVASQTHDPLLVAMATLLQQLPTVLFGLFAGALADRLDRRSIVVVADLARALVLLVLATAIVTGEVSIGLVLGTLFLLGTAECFGNSVDGTFVPVLLEESDYGLGNSRLMGGFIVANQLVGPPIGAALFATGMLVPFATQAVLVALGVLCVLRMQLPARETVTTERPHLRRDIAEGVRWLWESPPMRTLTITIVTFNVTFGAAFAVLVLYALEQLHLGTVGYGLLTTASALGGLVGTISYTRLERRVTMANIMRVGLIIETLTHLGLAVTTEPAVALGIFFVFGAHAFIWGTTVQTVRQLVVPRDFQGRVGSVYRIGVNLGVVVGGALGGVIARAGGVTAPFWFAFVGSAILLALLWKELGHIGRTPQTVDDAVPAPA
jgi:predicted MFS family arabinose efflux permease